LPLLYNNISLCNPPTGCIFANLSSLFWGSFSRPTGFSKLFQLRLCPLCLLLRPAAFQACLLSQRSLKGVRAVSRLRPVSPVSTCAPASFHQRWNRGCVLYGYDLSCTVVMKLQFSHVLSPDNCALCPTAELILHCISNPIPIDFFFRCRGSHSSTTLLCLVATPGSSNHSMVSLSSTRRSFPSTNA
jgi:hypothetical protein